MVDVTCHTLGYYWFVHINGILGLNVNSAMKFSCLKEKI